MTQKLRSLLLKNNQKIAAVTNQEKLSSFFHQIRPVTTNHKLIRLGRRADGGYLVPDDLGDVSACYSPGVDVMCEFEMDLTKKGIPCYLADASVPCPPVLNDLIDFERKFLGIDNSSSHITLEDWITEKTPSQSEFILQMDIEGHEYPVILDCDHSLLKKFRILVIEFHDLQNLFFDVGFDLIDITFRKLLKHFEIVHIHPNNYSKVVKHGRYVIPPLLEFTFLRKDRIASREQTRSFPHPFDRINNPDKDDIVLPECWYSG